MVVLNIDSQYIRTNDNWYVKLIAEFVYSLCTTKRVQYPVNQFSKSVSLYLTEHHKALKLDNSQQTKIIYFYFKTSCFCHWINVLEKICIPNCSSSFKYIFAFICNFKSSSKYFCTLQPPLNYILITIALPSMCLLATSFSNNCNY